MLHNKFVVLIVLLHVSIIISWNHLLGINEISVFMYLSVYFMEKKYPFAFMEQI